MKSRSGRFAGHSRCDRMWVFITSVTNAYDLVSFAVVILKDGDVNIFIIPIEDVELRSKHDHREFLNKHSGSFYWTSHWIVPKHHRPTSGLNLTLHTLEIKCFVWPSVHSMPCFIRIKSKTQFVGPYGTPPVSCLPRSMIFAPLKNVQLCVRVSNCLLQDSDSKFTLHAVPVACSFANRFGWTYIKGVMKFLSGLEAVLIHKL